MANKKIQRKQFRDRLRQSHAVAHDGGLTGCEGIQQGKLHQEVPFSG